MTWKERQCSGKPHDLVDHVWQDGNPNPSEWRVVFSSHLEESWQFLQCLSWLKEVFSWASKEDLWAHKSQVWNWNKTLLSKTLEPALAAAVLSALRACYASKIKGVGFCWLVMPLELFLWRKNNHIIHDTEQKMRKKSSFSHCSRFKHCLTLVLRITSDLWQFFFKSPPQLSLRTELNFPVFCEACLPKFHPIIGHLQANMKCFLSKQHNTLLVCSTDFQMYSSSLDPWGTVQCSHSWVYKDIILSLSRIQTFTHAWRSYHIMIPIMLVQGYQNNSKSVYSKLKFITSGSHHSLILKSINHWMSAEGGYRVNILWLLRFSYILGQYLIKPKCAFLVNLSQWLSLDLPRFRSVSYHSLPLYDPV